MSPATTWRTAGDCPFSFLLLLVASRANVLILDEPPNHLGIEAREALEAALRSVEGTVLLVPHDRALLDAVRTRTFALEDGTLRSYLGGWAECSRVREERRGRGEREAHGRHEAAGIEVREIEGERPRQAGRTVEENAIRRVAELEREVEKKAVEEAYARWEQAST